MTDRIAPVLAIADPTTEAQPAIDRAADFALRSQHPLVLLACVFDPYIAGEQLYPGIDLKKLRTNTLDQQMRRLRKLAQPLRERGLDVTARVVFDHPLHEGIVREVLRLSPAMVVKDTHHHSALSRILFSNTDWHLIRDCPAPLWLVKGRRETTGNAVMASVDPLHRNDKPASLDRQIVSIAQEMAALYGGAVHVAHASGNLAPAAGAALPVAAVIPADMQIAIEENSRREHREALDRFVADIGFPADQVHLRIGSPADVIPALAREMGAALVVLGAVSRSRLKRAFIGSTAEQALEALPTDVLIVKPDGFVCPVNARQRALGYMARTASR
jgi:universal stress protein E